MSQIHINQLVSKYHAQYDGLIDMSDYDGKKPEEMENAFLSRAQAGFALSIYVDASPQELAICITDGFDDNGIDAIYYDKENSRLYIVQSKFSAKGTSSIDLGDTLKFISGCNDLIEPNFDKFNDKTNKQKQQVWEAILNENTKIIMLIATTSKQSISVHVKEALEKHLAEINDTSEVLTYRELNQSVLYGALVSGTLGTPIDIDLKLHEWGKLDEPFSSYYGRVDASQIANWWKAFNTRILDKNIREFKGETVVNLNLKETLSQRPQDFWYFNNGITMLCDKIIKKPIYGSDRTIGEFACKGVSIVNGAQTVGSIGESFGLNPELITQAWAQVRIISLETCPPDYAYEVTRYNNTQNRIENKDFAALDPTQERLRRELKVIGVTYHYKSGLVMQSLSPNEFTIEEATIALACSYDDPALAVLAKRAIGSLWEDITKPPYKLLFPTGTEPIEMWNKVQIFRAVDKKLSKEANFLKLHRDRMICIHGNRLALHAVFKKIQNIDLRTSELNTSNHLAEIEEKTKNVLDRLIESVGSHFNVAYLNTLFKNTDKCRVLLKDVEAENAAAQGKLFEN